MPDTNAPHRAIMSYTRFDDQHNGGHLTHFCERLSQEVQAQSGEPFPIFQDIKDIKWGEPFEERIEAALNTAQFFIPILTPSFFKSSYCRAELEHFLRRAAELGRNDLILPVYYIACLELEDLEQRQYDELAQAVAQHQYVDWRDLRFKPIDSEGVRRMLAEMARQIQATIVRAEAELRRLRARAFTPRVEPDPKQRNAAAEALDRRGADTRTALELEHPDYWARRIEPGPFRMGDDTGAYDDEKPAFVAHIRRPYALARFPVTNRQYLRFLQDLEHQGRGEEAQQRRPRSISAFLDVLESQGIEGIRREPGREDWDADGYPAGKGNHPVVCISWEDSCAFAHWVNDLLHTRGILKAGEEVRLPTEIEWERAAAYPVRLPGGDPGTGRRIYPWGDAWPSPPAQQADLTATTNGGSIVVANTWESGIGGTTVVGIFPPGAADCRAEELSGNVWEWCSTPYQSYPLPDEITADTIYNSTEYRNRIYVLRGGSWYYDSSFARCARRLVGRPDDVNVNVGVRLARLFS